MSLGYKNTGTLSKPGKFPALYYHSIDWVPRKIETPQHKKLYMDRVAIEAMTQNSNCLKNHFFQSLL